MAWVKARFKAGGGFSPSEETKLALKFGIGQNLKHMQSKSSPNSLGIISLLLPNKILSSLMIINMVYAKEFSRQAQKRL